MAVSDSVSLSDCVVDITHERGRKGIGVMQGPGIDGNFPIVQPSVDIELLLADAYLGFIDNINQFEYPFNIRWLHGFGCSPAIVPITPVHSHDALIEDVNGVTVFDTRTVTPVKFDEFDWDGRLLILEWTDPNGQVLRMVKHTAWGPNLVSFTYDIYIEPVSGVLDSRVTYQLPKRITSVKVGLLTLKPDDNGDGNKLIFQNGFNTTIAVSEPVITDGDRRTTTLLMGAEAASGAGRFGPGCDDTFPPLIRRINTVQADNRGNFLLDMTGCYRAERPVQSTLQASPRQVEIRDHTLKLSNDCAPCCDCDDFLAVWEAIRVMTARYLDLSERAQAVRDLYHSNIDRWNEDMQCRLDSKLRVIVRPQCPDIVGVAIGFCNNSDECIEGLAIPIAFEYSDGTGLCLAKDGLGPLTADTTAVFTQIVPGSTFRSGNLNPDTKKADSGCCATVVKDELYQLGGAYPHFWAYWDLVNPGVMAYVTFRVQWLNPNSSQIVEVLADAFEIGPDPIIQPEGTPIPGYVPGSGPITTPASMRLTTCPTVQRSELVPDCDPEESLTVI